MSKCNNDKCGREIKEISEFYVTTNMWCCPHCFHVLAYSKWEAEAFLKGENIK